MEKLEYIGLLVEQNVNAEIMLIMAGIMLVPASLIALARYASVVIRGKDLKL